MTALIVVTLSACAPWQPAPVENRSERTTPSRPVARPSSPPANYEVRRGDTLYSIAFRFGLDWRSVAQWNRLSEPYLIRPGQELRMTAPPQRRPTTTRIRPRPAPTTTSPAPEMRPVEPVVRNTPPPATSEPAGSTARPSAEAEDQARAPAPTTESASVPDARSRAVAGVTWRWPTAGQVARPFDASAARRGLGIRGQAGQQVLAAAEGEVVYSGTALIGYGELIIIKHSGTMLSAYGHNRRRLVEEGARVRAGQPIAEMGLDETDEAILHFEIRRNGQPENPADFLPPRG
ncbi:MAG: peptidoglycan DD-metalloendopeptidase family protein [Pseudomonadota bacterium]